MPGFEAQTTKPYSDGFEAQTIKSSIPSFWGPNWQPIMLVSLVMTSRCRCVFDLRQGWCLRLPSWLDRCYFITHVDACMVSPSAMTPSSTSLTWPTPFPSPMHACSHMPNVRCMDSAFDLLYCHLPSWRTHTISITDARLLSHAQCELHGLCTWSFLLPSTILVHHIRNLERCCTTQSMQHTTTPLVSH
jgi:hypothetical protein